MSLTASHEYHAQCPLCVTEILALGAELRQLNCTKTCWSQAIVGGQTLLIVGVAEPIVLIYGYMYNFARDKPDLGEILPFQPRACGHICTEPHHNLPRGEPISTACNPPCKHVSRA